MSSARESEHIISARETLDSECALHRYTLDLTEHNAALHDISQLLNTNLDKETLATCVQMIESGVNPQALAVRNRFPVCFHRIHAIAGCNPRIKEGECRASVVVVAIYTRCIAYVPEYYRDHALKRRQPRPALVWTGSYSSTGVPPHSRYASSSSPPTGSIFPSLLSPTTREPWLSSSPSSSSSSPYLSFSFPSSPTSQTIKSQLSNNFSLKAHMRGIYPPLLPPEFSQSQLILQLGARHKSAGTVGTRQSRVLSHDVWSETSAQ